MKRKPNKPKQEPRERPGSWESPPILAGPLGAAPQAVPGGQRHFWTKCPPSQKFRQKSKQEQAAASKLRMEKRGEKLEAAKG